MHTKQPQSLNVTTAKWPKVWHGGKLHLKELVLSSFVWCLSTQFQSITPSVCGCQNFKTVSQYFLCLWFRASLICINNCPTRCNTKQSICYSASSLYMFRVSTTPIIRSTQNCNYSLRYWSYFLCSYLPATWPSLATCCWHPKHVEWTYRITNRLLRVASRWTIINIHVHVLQSFFLTSKLQYPESAHKAPSNLICSWRCQLNSTCQRKSRIWFGLSFGNQNRFYCRVSFVCHASFSYSEESNFQS